jgi:putative acetyltransferase
MREALNKAREMGFAGVILLGDPGYYRRFGFGNAKKKGLAPKQEGVPEECFMALQLSSDWPEALEGEIDLENLY